ncbi:MAG: 2'-5' RNA ligase family protein [Chitinivibrionales bacterium]
MPQPYAIWLLPSQPCHRILKEKITSLSSRYGAPVFNPHCTLCSASSNDMDSLVEQAAKISAKIEPFKIPVERIGYSTEYFQTLYVQLAQVEKLRATRAAFIQGLSLPAQNQYMPHISLLYARMTLTQKSALAATIRLPLEWVTITSAAVVIPDNPEGDWKDIQSWNALAHFPFEAKKEDAAKDLG